MTLKLRKNSSKYNIYYNFYILTTNYMENKNRRIAKNTILLYVRMVIMTLIMFYSSRVMLRALGVEDFGVYNIVAGIVVLFSFLNNTMTSSIQRFLNYLLGKGDYDSVKKVFVQSKVISYLFALIFILLSESIGLFYVFEFLNVPPERFPAAVIVFHLSIVGSFVTILRIPYQACIISYERMNVFAVISIADVLLKLLILWLLYAIPFDRLISYSILFCLASSCTTIAYMIYCYKTIDIVSHKLFIDSCLLRRILSFTGWNLLGSSSSVISTQGISVILNYFYGVIANTAMGIANQVLSGIYNIAASFTNAFNPVLVKSYAEGDVSYYMNLINKSSRLTYCLMWIVCLPCILWCEELLQIWLGVVPPFSVGFCRIMIVYALIEGISAPLWMIAQAEGNIKRYQIVISSFTFFSIILGLVLLLCFDDAIYVLVARLIVSVVIYIYRVFYINRLISFNMIMFYKDAIKPVIGLTIVSILSMCVLRLSITNSYIGFIMGIFITSINVILLGLTKQEKQLLIKKTLVSR